MKKIKVFISSIIEGYEDRRYAAEDAILCLNRDEGFNFEVIRAECFPAFGKKSPQRACLDGVNGSDIYLGIYGESYGWINPMSNKSPTEEEFDEAWKDKNRKHIFAFVEETESKEPRQLEFLKKVEDYIEGRFRKKFANIDALKYEVARALRNSGFEECLQNYLKTVLKKYEFAIRPVGVSVNSFPINEIVQLNLIEQHLENESVKKVETIEKFVESPADSSLVLSDVIKDNQKLIIVGNPGAGKSTLLQGVAHSYADQLLTSPQKEIPVPVYLELKWYKNSLLALVATYFGENNVVCDEDTLQDWIKKGNFIFLLDGFDELDDPSSFLKDFKKLISFSDKNRFVITSRKIEKLKDIQDHNLQFKTLEVKQLSDPQIELFIEKCIGKQKGDRLLKELEKHNLINEARNPLMLWFMTLEFQEDEEQKSINKGKLFKNVIENHFIAKWESKVMHAEKDIQKNLDLKIKSLSKLAFSMMAEKDLIKIEADKAKEIIDVFLKEGRTNYKDLRDEILRQLFMSHILIKAGSQISFWHKSFRDYFAAIELTEIFSKNPDKFMKQYVNDKWVEPILFSIGIMEHPSDFVNRLIQPLWKYFLRSRLQFPFQLLLSAKCLGANNKVNIATQQKVIDQLIFIAQAWKNHRVWWGVFPDFFDYAQAIKAIGETKSEMAARFLVEYAENTGNEGLGQFALEAIKNMPVNLIKVIEIPLLSLALQSNDSYSKSLAGEILAKNVSEEILEKLIHIISNKKEKIEVRKQAIFIIYDGLDLRNLKHQEAISPLIQIALEEECDDVRTTAASALYYYKGADKEEKIIDPLIHALLENSDANIRDNAGYALSYHFDQKVQKALIKAMDDKDEKVSVRAVHALAYNKPRLLEDKTEASQKLLRLFNDTDTKVRINALWTFGIIRKSPTDEEIMQLINLLKDNNVSVRYFAAEALGRLKARSALEALKQMIEDEEHIYPWAYAIWAILQIEPSFSEVIKGKEWEYPYINQLYDDDVNKRKTAVEILGRIGTEKALPFLEEIKKDYEKSEAFRGELFYAIRDIEERSKGRHINL